MADSIMLNVPGGSPDDLQEVRVSGQSDRSKKRVLAIVRKNELWHALDIPLLKQRQLRHARRAIPDELTERIDAAARAYALALSECDAYRVLVPKGVKQ